MSPVLALPLIVALAAAPAKKPVIAVLYFDNDSGKPELDVLQKGLADMLVTDLAAAGDQVTVVEREKLQKLLDELDLQKTKFFDPKTALKIGKGIGATHAVTGSFHSFEPKLRLDIRLVEIATSKVVLADTVMGSKEKFFELEQDLARRFLAKLDATLSGSPAKTAGADFDALLAYSKGLDLKDKGDLEQASKALADVARRSPAFALANQRQQELLLVLEALAQRRNDALFNYSDELLKNADAYLSTHDPARLKPDAARTFLAYRLVRGAYALFVLESRLGKGTPRCTLDGKAAEAKGLMQSYFVNAEQLNVELKQLPKGTKPALPAADLARARALGLPDLAETPDPLDAARFVLDGKAGALTVYPPLSMLDSRACDAAATLAWNLAYEREGEAALEALDLRARGLFTVGRTEEAVAGWKDALGKFPASPRYRTLEGRVKDATGLTAGSKQRAEDLRWFERSRRECKQDDLERAGPFFGKQRGAAEGLHGWRRTVSEYEQACGANPGLGKLYAAAAQAAATAGDCGTYDKLTAQMEKVDRSAAWTLKGEIHCDP